uniref:Retrovirus-related Pol polyprotein from transposon TNT 1-94 n=1 Tax=Tanacetum cinerariifolium TaxID=118510 RepID=A0A699I7R1_TANCI|nr:retrovirus-related Pol polyprotein from transposon TNT 1-94 [Tanacetum cinerariifolium]
MFKLDLVPLAPKLLQNRETHIDYLKYTQEQADILWGIVKQAKAKQPLDNALYFALRKRLMSHPKTRSIKLGLKCSTSNCGSKPTGHKKNVRILQKPSRNMKKKVEPQPRKVNKKNRVVEPIHNVDVKQSQLNANSDLFRATCKKSMFDDVHDTCLLNYVKNVNSHAKSAKKHKKQNIWKPTGHVFTEVGFKWKPAGRTFTIVGNSFPLTRITSANVVPPKKNTSHSVETQKPKLKIYSKKPKNVKNIGSSKKAKIVESKNANYSKPNHTWGSKATDIPSSSSIVMIGCPDCSLLDSRTTILQGLCGMVTIRLKDEAPEAIIKCIKNIQVPLNATIRNVRTDNGIEFFNKTLHEFYENVGISHQTFVAGTPQQNGIVERRNRTLIEAAHTMLIFSKAPLFLWAEAINTACYTQNRLLICLRYNKTPYELMQDKKPNLSFFYVFGALCYPTNDNEDLGKLDVKADNVPVAAAPRAIDLANSPVSTSIDQDAPSTKPKNFKQAMTESSWIDAMQEEIHEFERLQVWELVLCPDKVIIF